MQEQFILEMAKANCNDICKQVIFSLPMYPPPTLDALIDACEKKVPLVGTSKVPPPPHTVRRPPTAAVTQHPAGHTVIPPARTTQCYRCGQLGHMAKNCPANHPHQGPMGDGSGERVHKEVSNKKNKECGANLPRAMQKMGQVSRRGETLNAGHGTYPGRDISSPPKTPSSGPSTGRWWLWTLWRGIRWKLDTTVSLLPSGTLNTHPQRLRFLRLPSRVVRRTSLSWRAALTHHISCQKGKLLPKLSQCLKDFQ
ncbi:uncharacterized protein LOC111944914 [Cyanistes caeruleus]|uniref:uncharacterized protein LOC111944914 n=1 Tax=Cyanistes caeruleus TaxID=156563 RepID=UPI000CDB209F|nr:uncharacterized protein LOC111944914 [Cyanistes caeruleus]